MKVSSSPTLTVIPSGTSFHESGIGGGGAAGAPPPPSPQLRTRGDTEATKSPSMSDCRVVMALVVQIRRDSLRIPLAFLPHAGRADVLHVIEVGVPSGSPFVPAQVSVR